VTQREALMGCDLDDACVDEKYWRVGAVGGVDCR
jgi:hypothetical protein